VTITRITARPRGPLLVEGEIELVDLDGKPIDVAGRKRLLLCRCGASSTKPLCDGAHNRIAFESPSIPDTDEPADPDATSGMADDTRGSLALSAKPAPSRDGVRVAER